MVGLSQVEKNMEIKFKKMHQGAAFHGLCRIYSALWKQEIDSYESYGEDTRWMLYQKMLRMVFNVSWQDKLTMELYGYLPPVSSKVGFRRLKLASHCVRHTPEEASQLVLWQPMSGRMNKQASVRKQDRCREPVGRKLIVQNRVVQPDAVGVTKNSVQSSFSIHACVSLSPCVRTNFTKFFGLNTFQQHVVIAQVL